MDFLTDFQAKFVIDSEMEIMLNRTPRRPQESYLLPRLKVRLRFPKNNVSSLTFLVDTGGCT